MGDRSERAGYLPSITLVTPQGRHRLGAKTVLPEGEDRDSWRPPGLAREAMRWSYVLRSRERWRDSAAVLKRHQIEAVATLNGFGLDAADLRALAGAGQVVVELPYDSENVGWDGRIFPWEFVIASATRALRGGVALSVMRHLAVRNAAARWPAAFSPAAYAGRPLAPRVLFVQSFPGALAQLYDAQEERERVRAAFCVADEDWCALRNPTLQELLNACLGFQPEIVHLAGCDSHQGLALLHQLAGDGARLTLDGEQTTVAELRLQPDTVPDGYLMRDESGRPCIVRPADLGQALVAGGQHAPFFVGINVWHSAARLAPLLLAEGVLASMGFQDSFDDALAEYFYETLYARLRALRWNLPEAFAGAWGDLRRQADLPPGTGIALWARAPLLPPPGTAATPAPPVPAPAAVARRAAHELVLVDIAPKTEINYAELHNRRPLFERFELRCPEPAQAPQVRVEVELHCGPERARYATELRLERGRLPLHENIRVPLTATLLRSVGEAVMSSLFVRVSVGGEVVHADTHVLRLLPVDQWRDNDSSGQWLPSFVLPRDAAVERAVSAAQRYVRVIRDDPAAGFEGYQGALADDPDSLDQVDLQVEALWATLLHEWQLGYINPPPTYSAALDSQRLRTPGAIHTHRQGTCIDLALLFAACLELVDIYPVVFLLNGHALPGYWRLDSDQQEFRAARLPSDAPPAAPDHSDTARTQLAPWWIVDHKSVWPLIRDGRLVPLETVRLTEHCSFREAREAGVEALRSAGDFHSMLDIVIARACQITPLPILGDRL